MLKDFILLETIGKGSFATVVKVIRKSDNKVYALKRVKINKMSKKEIEDTLNEIRFLSSIRHKNIVGFLEAFIDSNDTELCIVMEYCSCGDLAQKVERYKRRRQYIDENTIWRYLVQSLKALQCLHEKGICHRDIKIANTFLGDDGSVKVGDMNVSKKLKKGQLQTQIGTPYYMSPEIWNSKPYDASSDIWSLGCMIYELAALRPPFLGDSFPTLKKAILAGRYPTIPKKYSDCLSKVIGMMLRLNPRERLTADQLMKCDDMQPKLALDDTPALCRADAVSNLMATIKIPGNVRNLNSVLPKPCYPELEQNNGNNQRPPLPPPPPSDRPQSKKAPVIEKLASNNENIPVQPNIRPHNVAPLKDDLRKAPPTSMPVSAAPTPPSQHRQHHYHVPSSDRGIVPQPPPKPPVAPSGRPNNNGRAYQYHRMW